MPSRPNLSPESLRALLGPVDEPGPLRPRTEDEVRCEGYLRRLVSYDVPSGRASAFVCLPTALDGPAPVVFCHHLPPAARTRAYEFLARSLRGA